MRMMYYSVNDRQTRKKKTRVLLSGVEPKTFRFRTSNRKVLSSTPDRSTRISFFRVCQCHLLNNISFSYPDCFLSSQTKGINERGQHYSLTLFESK